MRIKQVSLFLENKPGRLRAAMDALSRNGINVYALSLADAEEYGVLRIIVSNPELAQDVLAEEGIIARVSHVLAISIDDVPGGAVSVLNELTDAGFNIEYLYACAGRILHTSMMMVRCDRLQEAEALLLSKGYRKPDSREIYGE